MIARLLALPFAIVLAIPALAVFDVAGVSGMGVASLAVIVEPAVQSQLATAGPTDQITVIVHMRAEASLTAARRGTRRQRQRAVIDALRSTSDTTQQSLRAFLRTRRSEGKVQSFGRSGYATQWSSRPSPVWSPSSPPGSTSSGSPPTTSTSCPPALRRRRPNPMCPPCMLRRCGPWGSTARVWSWPGSTRGSTSATPTWRRTSAGEPTRGSTRTASTRRHRSTCRVTARPRWASRGWRQQRHDGRRRSRCDVDRRPSLQRCRRRDGECHPPGAAVGARPRRQPGHCRRTGGREQLVDLRHSGLQPRVPTRPAGTARCRHHPGVRGRELRPSVVDERQPGELPRGRVGRRGEQLRPELRLQRPWAIGVRRAIGHLPRCRRSGRERVDHRSERSVRVLDGDVDGRARRHRCDRTVGEHRPEQRARTRRCAVGRGGRSGCGRCRRRVRPRAHRRRRCVPTDAVDATHHHDHDDRPPTTTTTEPPTTTTTEPPTTTTHRPPTTTTTEPPTTTTTAPPGPTVLFADGFESGTTGAWSSSVTNGGRLSVTPAARLTGSYGLQAAIVNTTAMYVVDRSPASASSYSASFQFDPNTVALSGRFHQIVRALTPTGGSAITVELRAVTGGYQLRTAAMLTNGSSRYGTWVSVSDAPHLIGLAWVAASSTSTANGSLSWSIDGAAAAASTGLANSTVRIDETRLGPQGLGAGISGVEYFDAFTSSQTVDPPPSSTTTTTTTHHDHDDAADHHGTGRRGPVRRRVRVRLDGRLVVVGHQLGSLVGDAGSGVGRFVRPAGPDRERDADVRRRHRHRQLPRRTRQGSGSIRTAWPCRQVTPRAPCALQRWLAVDGGAGASGDRRLPAACRLAHRQRRHDIHLVGVDRRCPHAVTVRWSAGSSGSMSLSIDGEQRSR